MRLFASAPADYRIETLHCLALAARDTVCRAWTIVSLTRAALLSCTVVDRAWLLAAVTLAFVAILPGQARAEFTVCNQTLDVVNLAVGQKIDGAFQTDGWWTVGANQCVNVIREELTSRYVYIYATDVFGHPVMNGSTSMCLERRRFSIRGIDQCWRQGHIAAAFYEVDTHDQARWTMFLTGRSP